MNPRHAKPVARIGNRLAGLRRSGSDLDAAAIKKAPALEAAPTETNSAEARFRQTREHSALQRNCRVIAKP